MTRLEEIDIATMERTRALRATEKSEFEEMLPFFYNRQVPDEAVPQHMKNYSKRGDGKKLVWALPAQKLLLNAPLLRWYVEHGVDIKVICRIIRHVVCTAGEGSPAHICTRGKLSWLRCLNFWKTAVVGIPLERWSHKQM